MFTLEVKEEFVIGGVILLIPKLLWNVASIL